LKGTFDWVMPTTAVGGGTWEGETVATTGVLTPVEARYLDSAEPSAFADLYFGHREGVRQVLEGFGVPAGDAEYLVGDVFVRMMDQRGEIDRARPLSETLAGLASLVANELLAVGW
jgi:hypothetical protein